LAKKEYKQNTPPFSVEVWGVFVCPPHITLEFWTLEGPVYQKKAWRIKNVCLHNANQKYVQKQTSPRQLVCKHLLEEISAHHVTSTKHKGNTAVIET